MKQLRCSLQGYQPRPKMVTNSFGKKNFIQPMGRPKHALKVASYFLLSFFFGGGGFFFIFPQFLMGSHRAFNMFPKFPMGSPICYPQHLTFILLSLILGGQRGGILYFKIEPSIASIVSFFVSDGPIKLAYCNPKKKRELTRHII